MGAYLSIIGVGIVCLGLGYALGFNQITMARISAYLPNQEVPIVDEQATVLESEFIDVQLAARVQSDAADQLRADLAALHSENSKLADEVTFYKSLMAPGDLAKGLQIAELDIVLQRTSSESTETSARFGLLLTQVATRRAFIGGVVRVDVIGLQRESDVLPASGDAGTAQAQAVQAADEVVLSLTELTDLPTYPLKFRFRYFQDLAGVMTLPKGFAPRRVLVTAQQNGKEPLQATFPWPS